MRAQVRLELEQRQYRDLIRTLDFMGNYERISSYAQFRPAQAVLENPRAWWQFAFNCLVMRLSAAMPMPMCRACISASECLRVHVRLCMHMCSSWWTSAFVSACACVPAGARSRDVTCGKRVWCG